METMTLEELLEIGVNFEASVGMGTKSERARIPKNYSRINLSDDTINEIINIDKKITFLVSGEIWCPDFQLNATVLHRFCELNPNFDISVITMARGKKYLSSILGRDKESFKGPTVVALDKDLNILGQFEERPKSVRAIENFEDIKLDYYKGKYLLDSASDFLEIIR
ncbi:hypothetical protein CHL78_008790 [Romboutsia weinsteinii]|uniref:Thioredoxin family protein n=1 Tax=Romboutsia weinsteinii TaxID=2020949 RepID=A0A371J4B1_9FIRM|nr:thioredoxin family protein [Romboutsia weinsteinii]RDY27553.1 hypothetical protein CHL78_008790 [Romboutsia weinsteinii]